MRLRPFVITKALTELVQGPISVGTTQAPITLVRFLLCFGITRARAELIRGPLCVFDYWGPDARMRRPLSLWDHKAPSALGIMEATAVALNFCRFGITEAPVEIAWGPPSVLYPRRRLSKGVGVSFS